MEHKVRLAIFGTGQGAVQTMEYLDSEKTEIVCFLDSDKKKQGRSFCDRPIVPPEEALQLDVDYFLIGSENYASEMRLALKKAGVPPRNVFSLLQDKTLNNKSFHHMNRSIYHYNTKYASIIKDEHLPLFFKNYAICNMRLDIESRNRNLYRFDDYLLQGIDYVRLSTVELLSREIRENGIEGAVAELGVYQGHFSRVLEAMFPDRPLYLFDTFEGFHMDDVQIEQERAFSAATVGHLSDTSVDTVLAKLSNRGNVHVVKGCFPQSTRQTEDRTYAFVMIDVDLYQPIYEGLKYFYDRLSPGGYIMVHDYNFERYQGAKEAVRTFCSEYGLTPVPVSDFFGSALIVKPQTIMAEHG
jgi:hypothetical protein